MIRYNSDGVDDQPKGTILRSLTRASRQFLPAKIFQARDRTCAWTLADLCEREARFGKRLSRSGMNGVLQRLGLSHQKARSVHH